jgi:hypothetical protein
MLSSASKYSDDSRLYGLEMPPQPYPHKPLLHSLAEQKTTIETDFLIEKDNLSQVGSGLLKQTAKMLMISVLGD